VILSLSEQLKLDPYIVRVWFTNRRQKDKRVAAGGSASAGAAYRGENAPGPVGDTLPSPQAKVSRLVVGGRVTGPQTAPAPGPRPQGEPSQPPGVKRCHKAKGITTPSTRYNLSSTRRLQPCHH
jgi:hypothetical protein